MATLLAMHVYGDFKELTTDLNIFHDVANNTNVTLLSGHRINKQIWFIFTR